jgi:hypothetical protein
MNMVLRDGPGVEPYRVIVGFDNQLFRATAPLIELVATRNPLEFPARPGPRRKMSPWGVERAPVTKIYRVRGLMCGTAAASREKTLLTPLA